MNKIYSRITNLILKYEEFIGLIELRTIQNNVILKEQEFLQAQNKRREIQEDINSILDKRNEIISELENTTRGQKRFLQLVTEEHEIIAKENELKAILQNWEQCERDKFAEFSVFLRQSHEKERQHSERNKYWAIVGTVVGSVIGLLGATITSYTRNRNIRMVLEELNLRRENENSNHLTSSLKLEELMQRIKKENLLTAPQNDDKSSQQQILAVMEEINNRLKHQQSTVATSVGPSINIEELVCENSSQHNQLRNLVLVSTSILCISMALTAWLCANTLL